MKTSFIRSVHNEAVLKVLFKIKDVELTFVEAIQVVQETEEAATVAKETVYGQTSKPVYKVKQPKGKSNLLRASTYMYKAKDTSQRKRDQPFPRIL